MNNPYPFNFAPSDLARLAHFSIRELAAGHGHLVAVGMANSRAAHLLRCTIDLKNEINRSLEALHAASLAKAGFDPAEPRDSQGRWTNQTTSPVPGLIALPTRIARNRRL